MEGTADASPMPDANELIAVRRSAHLQTMSEAKAKGVAQPLALLAIGDSWFHYPVADSGLPVPFSDHSILGVGHLGAMGDPPPRILSLASAGQTIVEAVGLKNLRAIRDDLVNAENWFGGAPDAILISGGGDDLAGDPFVAFLDPAGDGLDVATLEGALDRIEATYKKLFQLRDAYAPGAPIFGHGYDRTIPDGRGLPLAFQGPWLKPCFDFFGYGGDEARQAMAEANDRLYRRHERLAADPANNYVLVDLRGEIEPGPSPPFGWANELHPYSAGFKVLAERFHAALAQAFPGRI